jgi:phosphatidylglycerol---prolipoprotein diacylglyceryl transferase
MKAAIRQCVPSASPTERHTNALLRDEGGDYNGRLRFRQRNMLIHPQFDPVAIHLGPIAIRWYGLMYLAAFAQFWGLGRHRILTRPASGWTLEQLDDLLFYGVLGVILGGRLGQVLFYDPSFYFAHPLEIVAIWKGGMSFHGGFLGVLFAFVLWSRKHGRHWLDTGDFIAPLVPLGLMAGRIGNFINGELWGRVAPSDLPWAMVFPQAGDLLPRHPSQIYHASLEGLALFLVLWFYSRRERPRGAVSGLFLIGYGICRSFVEFFREPDAGIFGLSYVVSMGQWLSLPMIAAGLWLLWRAHARPHG